MCSCKSRSPVLYPRLRGDNATRKRPAEAGRTVALLAEAELADQVGVALRVILLEVIKKAAALVDHHQEAAPAMIVLGVALEMLGQGLDAVGEDGDLDFGRTRIVLAAAMFLRQRSLALRGNRHRSLHF